MLIGLFCGFFMFHAYLMNNVPHFSLAKNNNDRHFHSARSSASHMEHGRTKMGSQMKIRAKNKIKAIPAKLSAKTRHKSFCFALFRLSCSRFDTLSS